MDAHGSAAASVPDRVTRGRRPKRGKAQKLPATPMKYCDHPPHVLRRRLWARAMITCRSEVPVYLCVLGATCRPTWRTADQQRGNVTE